MQVACIPKPLVHAMQAGFRWAHIVGLLTWPQDAASADAHVSGEDARCNRPAWQPCRCDRAGRVVGYVAGRGNALPVGEDLVADLPPADRIHDGADVDVG